MAKALRRVDEDSSLTPLAPVVSIPRSGASLRQPNRAGTTFSASLANAKSILSNDSAVYSTAKRRTSEAYSGLARSCQTLASGVAHEARRARNDHPLQVLAAIAAATFAAGVTLRIRRSNRE